jgi:anti-sigma-K factor RskA
MVSRDLDVVGDLTPAWPLSSIHDRFHPGYAAVDRDARDRRLPPASTVATIAVDRQRCAEEANRWTRLGVMTTAAAVAAKHASQPLANRIRDARLMSKG